MIANNITKDRYILEVTLEKALLIIPIVQSLTSLFQNFTTVILMLETRKKALNLTTSLTSIDSAINSLADYTSEIHDNSFEFRYTYKNEYFGTTRRDD